MAAVGAPSKAEIPTSPDYRVKTTMPPGTAFYGCDHVQTLLTQDQTVATQSIRNYVMALRILHERRVLATQTSRLHLQDEAPAITTLTPTYLCLSCPSICTSDEMKEHARGKGHNFAAESRSGSIYCHSCQDFVYDPSLEELRLQRNPAAVFGARKKRKLDELEPTPDELGFISLHASNAPCRATGLRGLYNMGQTCYMAVILQGLIHNPLLRNFYMAEGHKSSDCTRVDCLSCAMDEIISDFFSTDKIDGYGPVNVLSRSWSRKHDWAGTNQQDAHEFFQFLVDRLHCETTKFSEAESQKCDCIIHRTFYGLLRSDVTCRGCLNVTTREDPVMDLSLDLQQQFKKQKLNHTNTLSESGLSLQTCLQNFTSPEKLGASGYDCQKCSGVQHNATKQLSIQRLPPVLCIQLKRFEAGFEANGNSSKLETRIDFPLQLDLSPYTTRSLRSKKAATAELSRSCMYDLSTVIVHIGSMEGGHYVSYCREGHQWFLFDDNKVSVASEAKVLGSQAYLLMYTVRCIN